MKFDKIDKTWAASVALHLLVLGWAMLSFSSKAFELEPQDSVAVDTISEDQLAKVMAGNRSGKKENPKPLAEKVAEAKPGKCPKCSMTLKERARPAKAAELKVQ